MEDVAQESVGWMCEFSSASGSCRCIADVARENLNDR